MASEDRLVFVTTAECPVCHEKSPVVDRIAAEFGLPLERVDSDTSEGAARAAELRVRGVPTLALVRGERVPFRLLGRMITRENVAYFFSTQ